MAYEEGEGIVKLGAVLQRRVCRDVGAACGVEAASSVDAVTVYEGC